MNRTQMTSQIFIASYHGKINETDQERAIEAAEKVLNGVDQKAAFDAYNNAIEVGADPRDHSPLAATWDDASSAANIALTEGWHNPDGASVEIAVR